MRLHEIYNVCLEAYNLIHECIECKEGGASYSYEIRDRASISAAIEYVEKISFFDEYLPVLKVFANNKEKMLYTNSDLYQPIKELDIKLTSVIQLCESLGYTSEGNGFSVKVPMKDISIYAKCVAEFNIILQQYPKFKESDAIIVLKKVDVGSAWLEFCCTGVAAMTLLSMFADFVKKSIYLYSLTITVRQQKEQYKRTQISTHLMEEFDAIIEKITKEYSEKIVEEIAAGKDMDPEDKARAEMCFNKMVSLLDKGLEIHNTIEQEKDVKPLFPTTEQWEGINDKNMDLIKKLIEDKSGEENREK